MHGYVCLNKRMGVGLRIYSCTQECVCHVDVLCFAVLLAYNDVATVTMTVTGRTLRVCVVVYDTFYSFIILPSKETSMLKIKRKQKKKDLD